MIELRDVSFQYRNGGSNVRDINLSVKAGELIVLTGPSGSGKTTLTRIINGLAGSFYPGALTGRINLKGQAADGLELWRRSLMVGSVFQDPAKQFFADQINGEIAFGCENIGLPHHEIRSRVHETIEDFNLAHLTGQRLADLSSGEKQRLAVASIWAMRPEIYVFDEPSANLDSDGIREMGAIMRKLKESGRTAIVAEHRLHYLINLADRFVYMNNGRMVESFTGGEFRLMNAARLAEMSLRRRTVDEDAAGQRPPEVEERAGLEINGLSLKFKSKKVWHNLSCSVPAGSVTAFTGPNGAGKSSLARVLGGFVKESGGTVSWRGQVLSRRLRQRKVHLIQPNADSQLFGQSLLDELLLSSKPDSKSRQEARNLLHRLGLQAYEDKHPATLSGGQKQRLLLAAALMRRPEILILDEPTSGLDAGHMKMAAACLRAWAVTGPTVLVLTHDREFMAEVCDRVMVLTKEGFQAAWPAGGGAGSRPGA